jgi:hypothetical protein
MMMMATLMVLRLHHHGLPHHHLHQGPGALRLLQHWPKEKKHTSSLPPAGTPKKQKVVEKKIGPKKKLAHEMTNEELAELTRQEVIDDFKPKVLEKRVPIDVMLAAKFYGSLSDAAKR